MKKLTITFLSLLLVIQLFSRLPEPQRPAISFYQSIIQSIQSVQGRVIFYLYDGSWKCQAGSTKLLWTIDPMTKMTVSFQYDAGHLTRAAIRFNIPIHLQVLNTRCSSVRIDSLNYTDDGSIDVNPGIRWDNPECASPSTLANLLRAVSFSTNPKNLFNGLPFQNITGWQRSAGATPTSASIQNLLYEMKFYPEINQSAALRIAMKGNAPIYFSTADNNNRLFNNYTVLNPGSELSFADIDYKFDTQELSGTLLNLTLNVQRGTFATADCILDLTAGSNIVLNNINFYNNASNSIIDASGGTINTNLSAQSFINLNATPINNKLYLQDNTTASLLGFRLTVNERKSTTIEIGNGSKLQLKIAQGTLSFGAKGFINIVNSEIDAELAAVFQSGQPPSVIGRFGRFDVNTRQGEIYPNEVSKLLLGSGNLHSNELHINSTSPPYITGTFDNFSAKISNASVFAIPNNGLQLQTKGEGEIAATDLNKPLRLVDGYNYPTGTLSLNLPYDYFVNSMFRKIALFDGNLKGIFSFDINNAITGSDINISGKMQLNVQLDQGYKKLGVDFNINSANLSYANGHPQQFSGIASARISLAADASFLITTPASGHVPDHDDARVYPITLAISAREPINIGPTQIGFSGTTVSLNFSTELAMNLTILQGKGQYVGDSYTPTEGGQDGPDWTRHLQELARDKALTSTVHVYLFDKTYPVKGALSVSYDNTQSKIDIQLSNLQCPPVAFNTDGGGIWVAFGDALAFLFNGICDILPFISCNVQEPSAAITNAISAQIARKIQQFNSTWQIAVDR